ncbi:hypothetical protein PUN28_000232 [Cardiocondyla obscurior]|uniref:Uncharacterized protein n=1 Tax=Cardiocondyla obscurior TaxID=286306 RepID=A0AAW2GYS8_9HYME
MFYLDGRDAGGRDSSPGREGNFGWWLSDLDITESSKAYRVKNRHRSLGSFLSSTDSNDSESCDFARDVSKRSEENKICEIIELSSFTRHDFDLFERDAGKTNSHPATVTSSDVKEKRDIPVCYTPDRLIRSQEYQIPAPRRLTSSRMRFAAESESKEWKWRYQKRSSEPNGLDSKQIGTTQLMILLNFLPRPNVKTRGILSPAFDRQWTTADYNAPVRTNDDPSIDGDEVRTVDSSRLSSLWDDKDPATRLSSPENTSGIQSYDWSLETLSDAQNTSMCLYDELPIAKEHAENTRDIAIDEVASILEDLRSHPGRTPVRLKYEEDRFSNNTSSHDELTRLALTIETDVEPAISDDPNYWIYHLRDKIEQLQLANKEIHRDIRALHASFQCDEKKVINLLSGTTRLLEDIHYLRHVDDVVKLLEGKLVNVPQKNWPFILGRKKIYGEINLII